MKRTILALAISNAFGTVMANPTGPVTVSGATLVSNPSASVLQVVNTPGAIMHWNTFSIAGGETTRFVQQSAASAILNRVVGASPSDILGRLESNGRVFLVNPNGILFGAGSVVDVAGLIASTRNISDANFLAGNYLFDGPGSGTITLQGGAQILTSTYGAGGQVWLFAKNITQEAGSTITAPQGQVVLAAGTQLQVGTSVLGNMSFTVTTDGTNNVDSLGTIAAERGAVGLFADNIMLRDGARVDVSAGTSGNGGSISANARTLLEIERLADVAADGGGSSGNGGTISLSAADVRVSPVANAYGNVHASARAAGATVGTVTVDQTGSPGLVQVADLQLSGGRSVPRVLSLADGSHVVVWAGDSATFDVSTVRAMRVDVNGSPIGGPVTITTTAVNGISRAAALKGGGYAVIWQSREVGDNASAVHVVIVDSSGAIGPSIDLTTLNDFAREPSIAALTNGGFVAAWLDRPGGSGDSRVMAQRFNANGSPVNSAQNLGIAVAAGAPSVAGLADGGFLVFTGRIQGLPPLPPGLTPTNLWRVDRGGQLAASSTVAELSAGVSGLVGGGYALGLIGGVCCEPGRVRRFSANGAPIGSDTPFQGSFPWTISAAASVAGTADGRAIGVTGGFESVTAAKDGGHTVGYQGATPGVHLRILARQAVPSSAGLASGDAGAAASFATAPGVSPGDLAPPPPPPPPAPPPVVSGRPGGGASFGGVAGCNSMVCANEVRGALAVADASRAAAAVDRLITIDAQRAADAVRALQAAEQARRADTGAGPVGPGLVIRDFGEMGRLTQQIAEFYQTATPDQIRDTAAAAQKVIGAFLERETLTQQLGVDPANPNEVRQVDLILNMSEAERAAYFQGVVTDLQLGQDR